ERPRSMPHDQPQPRQARPRGRDRPLPGRPDRPTRRCTCGHPLRSGAGRPAVPEVFFPAKRADRAPAEHPRTRWAAPRRDGCRREAGAPAGPAHEPPLRLGPADSLRARVITAIYPGTYDPVTNGHVDVITRAAGIFDRVVVGVVGNPQHKEPMFDLDERVGFLREALSGVANVEVDVFSELVVDFAHKWDAKVIVKGLRVISDFEWEFQMNQLNRTLAPDVETVYVMASPAVSFVSSSGVKEIAAFGGTVDELVPA